MIFATAGIQPTSPATLLWFALVLLFDDICNSFFLCIPARGNVVICFSSIIWWYLQQHTVSKSSVYQMVSANIRMKKQNCFQTAPDLSGRFFCFWIFYFCFFSKEIIPLFVLRMSLSCCWLFDGVYPAAPFDTFEVCCNFMVVSSNTQVDIGRGLEWRAGQCKFQKSSSCCGVPGRSVICELR